MYWREVVSKLWQYNASVLGEASDDHEVVVLVFRLTSRAPLQFDLVEAYNEKSTVLANVMSAYPPQDSTGNTPTVEFVAGIANDVLSELGNNNAKFWDAVWNGDTASLETLSIMARRASHSVEELSCAEACIQYPHWRDDAFLTYIAPDGADLGDALDFRMHWYLHGSKEFISLQSTVRVDADPPPLARILSLQSYLARQRIPCVLTSVNSFGMFRQIVNWFLLAPDEREQMINLYGDENAGLYHVPAVLHRQPDWQPLDGAHSDGLATLALIIKSLFLERLPGIPADDDESLAQFEGRDLLSCSMSVAHREIGESCLHYYSTRGVSMQSQRIAAMSDEELMHVCSGSADDDGYGDKGMLFHGYAPDMHQALAELFVSFRGATGGEFRSYLQAVALVGEDTNGPQSLDNSVYVSGRFGNYQLAEMFSDEGLSLWKRVKHNAIEIIRQDMEECSDYSDGENRMLDSRLQRLLKDALHLEAGAVSNGELRARLLNLERDCWPSCALPEGEVNTSVNAQVRVVPNSAVHMAPIRTFRFFTNEDRRQLNDFVETNIERLDSLRNFLTNS
ncbi:unnamed protein product [Prorocentrum cordatum]|uniref:Uncharacterized protein n=1 Tax=Prorocentrum cordatum TaxID=2364126 RepID=A0ABN9X534_9DINO|nr:unnamed protein product [Polarella glacialis]